MKDAETSFMLNLITQLIRGGTLRRADSRQEPDKQRGESLLTLDLIRMRTDRVHKD